ncbi:MAG: hypothetical protein LBF50_08855 [Azoarcus sp.]|jgi:hypothetical protein|nr:hypothetical protein [Azoarcus sp.]
MADTYQWLSAALIPAQTALRDRIDLGGLAGAFSIYDSSDTLLATLALATPSGTIDSNGKLTLSPGAPESNAPASGVAHHAVLRAGDGTALLNIDVIEGTAAQAGYIVISTANIIAGGSVSLIAASVG